MLQRHLHHLYQRAKFMSKLQASSLSPSVKSGKLWWALNPVNRKRVTSPHTKQWQRMKRNAAIYDTHTKKQWQIRADVKNRQLCLFLSQRNGSLELLNSRNLHHLSADAQLAKYQGKTQHQAITWVRTKPAHWEHWRGKKRSRVCMLEFVIALSLWIL